MSLYVWVNPFYALHIGETSSSPSGQYCVNSVIALDATETEGGRENQDAHNEAGKKPGPRNNSI